MRRCIATILLGMACASVQAQHALPEDEHDCFIVPSQFANVGSPVRGIVSKLLVDRGDTVIAGQQVASLESDAERILQSLAAVRAEMDSEIVTRESEFELSKLQFARVEDLYKQGLVPAQQHDEARVRRQIAHASLLQALGNKELVLLELQRANNELSQRTITSPMDGVVVEQFMVPGEFIYDEPIMSIAALDPLRVEVVLPAELFGSVNINDKASVRAELNLEQSLQATVDVVDALLDTRSGTFGVRLTLPNAERLIPAGQRCTVEFDIYSESIELAEDEG